MATGDYEYAEPDWICHPTQTIPNDPSYPAQWHHIKVRSPFAWDTTTGDASLVIAIVDGGVMLDHTDLVGALVPGYNAADDLAQSAGGDVSDVDGHGTFVAGLAGAVGNNGIHVAGIGWDFSLMPVRYYNSPGGGYLHHILAGARWAADHGARCVNVSQTGVEYNSVQTTGAYLKNRGSLLFWAAGNDSRDLSWFDWDDVIIVGATNPNDGKASFSAYGQAVDVYAPGTNIVSTGLPGGLATGSGTSASTPIVAGICALIWSNRPHLTADEVEERLYYGCVDLGAPGNDSYWGWGRVDSYASVGCPEPTSYCTTSPNSAGAGAVMWYMGSSGIAADDLTLVSLGCPPSQFGLFYTGTERANTPAGDGILCAGGSLWRFPALQVDGLGIVDMQVDYDDLPAGLTIQAGDTWRYSFWYRDPGFGTAGYNFADGLEITFCP